MTKPTSFVFFTEIKRKWLQTTSLISNGVTSSLCVWKGTLPPNGRRSWSTGRRGWLCRTWRAWTACCTRSCKTPPLWPQAVRPVGTSRAHPWYTVPGTWPRPTPWSVACWRRRPRSTLWMGRKWCRKSRFPTRFRKWRDSTRSGCRSGTPARRRPLANSCGVALPCCSVGDPGGPGSPHNRLPGINLARTRCGRPVPRGFYPHQPSLPRRSPQTPLSRSVTGFHLHL